jgi:demethylmenaquinone methyltransferase / 2-methoxy-6-polyprenyl-1,4-benzoquinol methylase
MEKIQHSRDIFVRNIFAAIANQIDFLSSLFCFGMDKLWRKKLVHMSGMKGGESVLDLCTGTGKMALLLSRKVGTQGSVFGVDFCREMLNVAKKNLGTTAPNISFFLSDAKDLQFQDNTFDVVTVSFGMRNIRDTSMALQEALRVLKPGGKFFCLELTCPQKRWFMPFYNYYCFNTMPSVAKIILKTDIPYNYLPRSIQAFPLADEFRQIMEQCGFSKVEVHPLTLGIATIFGAKKN